MASAPRIDPVPSFAEAMEAMGLSAFPEQAAVAARLERTTRLGMVGFVEAPTATGKTHAISHSALSMAADGQGPVVLAVPTIGVGQQSIISLEAMRDANPAFSWMNVAMVVGRQGFLSPDGLEDLVAILPTDAADAVRNWIDDGAPGRTPSNARWTRDGLEHHLDTAGITGTVVPDTAALALGASDKGSASDQAYRRQFVTDADVVVATHAMLGRDLLSRFVQTSKARKTAGMSIDASLTPAERWLTMNIQRLEVETGDEGRLPDHRRLIVDEAHLLRDAVQSAMSTDLSVCALVRHCTAMGRSAKSILPKKTIDEIKLIRKELTRLGEQRDGAPAVVAWSGEDETLQRIVLRLHDALARVKTGAAPADLEQDAEAIKRAQYALAESLRARDAVSTVFEWSPVMGFPTITVGRRGLNAEFDFLWNRLESAALVSATLYTENVDGPSPAFMKHRLGVPDRRVLAFAPITAAWLRKPVTVHLPSKDAAIALKPDREEARIDHLAGHVARIAGSSDTGMLVLNTRISTTRALAQRLRLLVDPKRVIDGTSDRLSRLKDRYVSMARAGLRPIWLAQGPAWTGLDLPDDTVDTLAITKLPFPRPDPVRDGGNAAYGQKKVAEMAMAAKQGIGRLVRTRDASPKTLHMLDGGIHERNAGGVLALLKTYNHVEFENPKP